MTSIVKTAVPLVARLNLLSAGLNIPAAGEFANEWLGALAAPLATAICALALSCGIWFAPVPTFTLKVPVEEIEPPSKPVLATIFVTVPLVEPVL